MLYFFFIYIISTLKLLTIFILIPLWFVLFSLVAFKIFCLSLILDNLNMSCLGKVFFMPCPGIFLDLLVHSFLHNGKKKFDHYFKKIFPPPIFFYIRVWLPVSLLDILQFTGALFSFFSLSVFFKFWIVSMLFSSSQIFSSAASKLQFIPSSVFFHLMLQFSSLDIDLGLFYIFHVTA